MERTVDLVVYPDAAFGRLSGNQLRESLTYFDPDVVVVEEPFQEARLTTLGNRIEVVHLHNWTTFLLTDAPGPQLAAVSGPSDFEILREREQGGHVDTDAETYVLADELSVDINLTDLMTRLEGRDTYEPAFEDAALDGSYTHLTSKANPDYRNNWDGAVPVQGIFPAAAILTFNRLLLSHRSHSTRTARLLLIRTTPVCSGYKHSRKWAREKLIRSVKPGSRQQTRSLRVRSQNSSNSTESEGKPGRKSCTVRRPSPPMKRTGPPRIASPGTTRCSSTSRLTGSARR
ncbi:MAG: hypothetical protein U5K28_04930 [Halobacteriales archaeon]|nr:hypothetical protein [Halobacteriales archaeon]